MESLSVEKQPIKLGTWIALFAGFCAGAACGILFAPKPGSESRTTLKNWLSEKREVSRHVLQARRARIGAALTAAKSAYQYDNEHADIGG